MSTTLFYAYDGIFRLDFAPLGTSRAGLIIFRSRYHPLSRLYFATNNLIVLSRFEITRTTDRLQLLQHSTDRTINHHVNNKNIRFYVVLISRFVWQYFFTSGVRLVFTRIVYQIITKMTLTYNKKKVNKKMKKIPSVQW